MSVVTSKTKQLPTHIAITETASHASTPSDGIFHALCGRYFCGVFGCKVEPFGTRAISCKRCVAALGPILNYTRADNQRRCDIIAKMHSGFTKEELRRPFADYPEWAEECDLRHRANLTDDERAELANLEARCDEFMAKVCPRDTSMLDEAEARIARLKEKVSS